MTRSPATLAAASAFAALFAAGGLGCGSGPAEPTCDGAATPGAMSLFTECGDFPLAAQWVPVVQANGTSDPAWIYHACGDEVPWLSKRQADGTWKRLLPPDYFLPTECHHVMEIAPGEAMDLAVALRRAEGPGTYRAETLAAWGCVDLHHAVHVPHSCARQDFVVSEPFELH